MSNKLMSKTSWYCPASLWPDFLYLHPQHFQQNISANKIFYNGNIWTGQLQTRGQCPLTVGLEIWTWEWRKEGRVLNLIQVVKPKQRCSINTKQFKPKKQILSKHDISAQFSKFSKFSICANLYIISILKVLYYVNINDNSVQLYAPRGPTHPPRSQLLCFKH